MDKNIIKETMLSLEGAALQCAREKSELGPGHTEHVAQHPQKWGVAVDIEPAHTQLRKKILGAVVSRSSIKSFPVWPPSSRARLHREDNKVR